MKRLLACLLACSILLTVGACGGGGGGGDGDADGGDAGNEPVAPEVLGPRFNLELVVRSQGGMFTEAGPAEVDADGNLTGDGQRYFNFLSSPEALSPSRLVVAPGDGTLTQFDNADNLVRVGGVGEGSHLALLAAGDNLPNALMLARPATGLSNGSVAGGYHFTLFSPSLAVSIWGRVDFDGSGGGSFPSEAIVNADGVLDDAGLASMAYQVGADGALQVEVVPDGGEEILLQGVASNGGRLLLASRGEDDAPPRPFVLAAVRAAANADAGTFTGRYWFLGFLARSTDGVVRFVTLRGTLDADGAGGCILNASGHLDTGIFQELTNEIATYVVDRDGALEIEFQDIDLAFAGGLDAQGRHAVLGGSQIATFFRSFVLLARQP